LGTRRRVLGDRFSCQFAGFSDSGSSRTTFRRAPLESGAAAFGRAPAARVARRDALERLAVARDVQAQAQLRELGGLVRAGSPKAALDSLDEPRTAPQHVELDDAEQAV
jgi:hypothetical protein